jgi:hypothetical protein
MSSRKRSGFGVAAELGLDWSDDARVMARPFRAYARLGARHAPAGWRALRGPIAWSLAVGCFVSLTTAGRLVPEHLVLTPIAWAFSPLFQCLWVVTAARALGASRPASLVIDLHFRGQGPWMLLLTLTAGACLLPPAAHIWPLWEWVLTSGAGLAALVVTLCWSTLLTFASFRAGLRLGRARSLAASALFYALYYGTGVTYFLVTGQLAPLFGA